MLKAASHQRRVCTPALWELSQGGIIGRPHLLIHLETYHYVTYQLPCLNG